MVGAMKAPGWRTPLAWLFLPGTGRLAGLPDRSPCAIAPAPPCNLVHLSPVIPFRRPKNRHRSPGGIPIAQRLERQDALSLLLILLDRSPPLCCPMICFASSFVLSPSTPSWMLCQGASTRILGWPLLGSLGLFTHPVGIMKLVSPEVALCSPW
ncbi:hypothetical protein EDB80DRAFT_131372 [Ilyonectria destructans]|nr:hypothetical protein EDB80DRAFT_131372 [Ilyonectria destructans]